MRKWWSVNGYFIWSVCVILHHSQHVKFNNLYLIIYILYVYNIIHDLISSYLQKNVSCSRYESIDNLNAYIRCLYLYAYINIMHLISELDRDGEKWSGWNNSSILIVIYEDILSACCHSPIRCVYDSGRLIYLLMSYQSIRERCVLQLRTVT